MRFSDSERGMNMRDNYYENNRRMSQAGTAGNRRAVRTGTYSVRGQMQYPAAAQRSYPAVRQNYVSGTAARKTSARAQQEARQRAERQLREQEQARAAAIRNRERAARMNPAMILFLAGIIAIMSVILIQYISLQARVTESMKEIASLESTYATLKESNDEMLNEINAGINLDDIKFRAITELGMTYADQGQIVTYAGETGDYVQQVREIGN